ncbi:hypothetical protein BST81_09165 [Leptolyngbya sp. 'hensonii']|uniref:hypothetical protein n=1 Tax=Leptolyngbya sp. 'hensonii' TaxID=1922337 RepID=UPI00094FB43F|nr:hypothetical protein [Leptolyngbya sp. 'hensonii']OLP18740.1 hypothetical protein BST81_09165 [Leptolyngbya sp. 'hensonii']
MIVRYQADADLNQAIVTGVLRREPTIDFQTAFAAGFEGVKDLEVLAIAAQQGRILVSGRLRVTGAEFEVICRPADLSRYAASPQRGQIFEDCLLVFSIRCYVQP